MGSQCGLPLLLPSLPPRYTTGCGKNDHLIYCLHMLHPAVWKPSVFPLQRLSYIKPLPKALERKINHGEFSHPGTFPVDLVESHTLSLCQQCCRTKVVYLYGLSVKSSALLSVHAKDMSQYSFVEWSGLSAEWHPIHRDPTHIYT